MPIFPLMTIGNLGTAPAPYEVLASRSPIGDRWPVLAVGVRDAADLRLSTDGKHPQYKLRIVAYQIVDPASISAGPGPHPAASPFDKRISAHLGVSAFEVYQIELPPGAETVRHDHLDDQVEDVYLILRGEGWVLVDSEQIPIKSGQFIAVTVESVRQIRAGENGLAFVALCGAPR